MASNDALVDRLVQHGRITTERVEAAFRAVDRARFVPATHRDEAYADTPLPIGADATISAPHMVAVNTELLDVQPDNRVVEVGSGSGYQLAILAELAAAVTGVEIDEALVDRSRAALEPWPNAEVVHGNGLNKVDGSFDRILFSCAIDAIDQAVPRVEPDGVVVAPVNAGLGQTLTKWAAGETSTHSRVRFVQFREE